MLRTIRKVVIGNTQYDGAGVKLVRVIGHSTVDDFDPFLMLDAFDSKDPNDYIKGFPWHPHRGIETITYLIYGDIEHSDSLGNKGSILDGCCQWMTAGSGILHQEMPKAAERMLGVQLWLNLPKKDKMTKPQYRDLTPQMIPKIKEDGREIRIISGQYKETPGPVSGEYIKTLFLDISLEAHAEWKMKVGKDDTIFVYIIEGEAYFEPNSIDLHVCRRALLFNEGEELYVKASDHGTRFLLLSAKPLNETIAWGGPIVMNTKQELDQAFEELDNGTFIK